MVEQDIVLVDEKGIPIGTGSKMDVHERGLRHLAFSLFVFNSKNELLLQQRALTKYHSPGLWTNTCCSHPKPGEDINTSVRRRLEEEMNFHCEVYPAFEFLYRNEFENGLIEFEYDHVYIGHFEGEPFPEPKEVNDYAWSPWKDVLDDLSQNPDNYTYWFAIAYPKVIEYMKNKDFL